MQIFKLTLLLVVAAFAAVEVANGESFNATLKKPSKEMPMRKTTLA